MGILYILPLRSCPAQDRAREGEHAPTGNETFPVGRLVRELTLEIP
jgi:hypothetical protein